jgi:hypothetical protein
MTTWWDRVAGTPVSAPPPDALPGRYLVRSGAEVAMNGVPAAPWDHLTPGSGGAWVAAEDGTASRGRFALPELLRDQDASALARVAERLNGDGASRIRWAQLAEQSPLARPTPEQLEPTPTDVAMALHGRHLLEVCRRPHTILDLTVEPTLAARARRVPPSAVQHLAAHSEDWHRRTAASVIPRRVLAQRVDERLDVYENRVVARLVDELLRGLKTQLANLQDLGDMLGDVADFSTSIGAQHRLARRLGELWGEGFDDSDQLEQLDTLRDDVLTRYRRVAELQDSALYRAVPRRARIDGELRQTNVLVDHQHYRRVAALWRSVVQKRPSAASREEAHDRWQAQLRAFDGFCLQLLVAAMDRFGLSPANDEELVLSERWSLTLTGAPGPLELEWDPSRGATLRRDGAALARFVPLAAELSGLDDGAEQGDAQRARGRLDQLTAAGAADAQATIVLYPASRRQRKAFTPDVRRRLNPDDAGIPPSPSGGLRCVPVSPLDLLSLERVERVVRRLVLIELLERFPPEAECRMSIRDRMIGLTRWLAPSASRKHVLVTAPPSEARRAELAAALKTMPRGTRQRDTDEFRASTDAFVAEVEVTAPYFASILRCPVCSASGTFHPRDAEHFVVECGACKSNWGLDACGDCGGRIPYLDPHAGATLPGADVLDSLDRTFGRDVLAVPIVRKGVGAELLVPGLRRPHRRTLTPARLSRRNAVERVLEAVVERHAGGELRLAQRGEMLVGQDFGVARHERHLEPCAVGTFAESIGRSGACKSRWRGLLESPGRPRLPDFWTMKADALTPRDLFDGKVQYEIPSFQRPYVWTEEDQWAPLWSDVRRVALAVIAAAGDQEKLHGLGAHFLGAVVLKEVGHQAGDVARSAVIDGQQRMTTLQILLDAAHAVVAELGYEDDAEFLEDLILNSSKKFVGTKDRFKLWPSRADRAAFAAAMDGSSVGTGTEHRIGEAHAFFGREVRRWLVDGADEGESSVADQETRVAALADVLQSRLYLVAINLGLADDDQLIFETLNDRGTPLLAADLIKNWIFQRGEDLGVDTDVWAEQYWVEFDEDWWRQQISQGRHMRSRIDIFLQYWLTMREKDEIPSEGIFRRFRTYTMPFVSTQVTAEALLGELRRDADTFRSFAQLSPDSAAGRFYASVVESFELAATTPLLLWMLSENHQVPEEQVEVGLSALESWVIRRTLLRMTMKDVNKLMVAMLGELDKHPVSEAGTAARSFLAAQTADARVWPTDSDLLAGVPNKVVYGNIRQGRLRVVLEGVEKRLRTARHESTALPPKLEIEHVMPQSWHGHWDQDPPLGPQDAAARKQRVNTLGNLTLVTQKLNGSLSHRPWTDAEAAIVAPKGKDAGMGKRSLLDRYSLLVLNKKLVGEHPEAWTDEDIVERGREITRQVCEVWPRPAAVEAEA